jgi:hypothetical protein
MTVDSQSLGSYDWAWKNGNQTISATQPFDWFTATQDTRSAWVIVDGDLTINAGMELRPTSRKLFTVVYVTGDLACNGSISMSQRGANHSGTGESGGATTAAAILIATGTFSTVVDPKVPAAGGAGGAAVSTSAAGNVGAAGTGGGTGGGGSGATAAAVVTSNVITSVYLTNPGSGYTTSPTFTIVDANTTPGTGATVIYNGEDSKSGGNANVRYITRRITLADGFDSGDLRVYLTAYKPAGSSVLVYYKMLSGSDLGSFDDKNYQLMTEIGNPNFISTNPNDYRELTFATGLNGEANNSVSYASGSTTYRSFRTFAIKIVLTG